MNEVHCTPADRLEIGGKDLLASAHAGSSEWPEALEDIRVRVGTLLKTETVSFLLGAGASVDCGGASNRLRSAAC